jgi:hypothetical protein
MLCRFKSVRSAFPDSTMLSRVGLVICSEDCRSHAHVSQPVLGRSRSGSFCRRTLSTSQFVTPCHRVRSAPVRMAEVIVSKLARPTTNSDAMTIDGTARACGSQAMLSLRQPELVAKYPSSDDSSNAVQSPHDSVIRQTSQGWRECHVDVFVNRPL